MKKTMLKRIDLAPTRVVPLRNTSLLKAKKIILIVRSSVVKVRPLKGVVEPLLTMKKQVKKRGKYDS